MQRQEQVSVRDAHQAKPAAAAVTHDSHAVPATNHNMSPRQALPQTAHKAQTAQQLLLPQVSTALLQHPAAHPLRPMSQSKFAPASGSLGNPSGASRSDLQYTKVAYQHRACIHNTAGGQQHGASADVGPAGRRTPAGEHSVLERRQLLSRPASQQQEDQQQRQSAHAGTGGVVVCLVASVWRLTSK